jgi:hypothetical protein
MLRKSAINHMNILKSIHPHSFEVSEKALIDNFGHPFKSTSSNLVGFTSHKVYVVFKEIISPPLPSSLQTLVRDLENKSKILTVCKA